MTATTLLLAGATPKLTGKRVLVVEDEAPEAILIQNLLEDCECSVVGPCATVGSALAAACAETFDLALLDVNLRGAESIRL